jgi:ABC-type amino acid transport substrate-binding protein
MRRRFFSLRCAFALCGLLAGCVPSQPSATTELPDFGGRTVTVALLPDNLPFSGLDPATGVFEGFDHDLLTTLAARVNLQPQFVAGDWATLLADVMAGRYDVAGGGIAFTVARAEQLDFASPYRLVKDRIVMRAADQRADTIAAFHDQPALRAGSMTSTTTYDFAVGYLGADRVVGFPTNAEAVDALLAGTIDGVVIDEVALVAEEQRQPGMLAELGGPVAGEVAAYILPKGSDLTAGLNAAFKQVQTEGVLADLRRQWGL